MAINLKPVDVAVIGLGAAGGVAVLPLARAGLKVAGIEAGTWMDPAKDFHADEIFNNVRGLVTTGNKIRMEAPTVRNSPTSPTRRGRPSPMMNAIGGTTIHYHAQHWRLKPWDFKTVSEVKKRYGASYIPKGSTLEDWPIGYDDLEPYYDTVEYEVGVSGKAGNIQGKLDPAGNVFEGPRRREYPMPPLRTCDYLEHMKSRGAIARVEAVSFALRDQFGALQRPRRVRLSRLLRPWRLPSARQELDLFFDDPSGAENQTSDDFRQRARHADSCGFERQSDRSPIPSGRERIFSARQGRDGGMLHLRECAAPAAFEIQGLSQRTFE